MELTIGNKVFYPYHGLCIIGPIVKKMMQGKAVRFYHLSVLGDGGDLFVPIEKIATVGIRPLLKQSEIPKLLNHFKVKHSSQVALHYSQQALLNTQLITSGSAFDLVEVVWSLSAVKTLSFGQRRTLDRARRLLIGEISEVMGETKNVVEEQIDQALKARKKV